MANYKLAKTSSGPYDPESPWYTNRSKSDPITEAAVSRQALISSVVDGDTINGARLQGIDSMESVGFGANNAKAQKIANKYGVSLSDQERIGHLATEELRKQLMNPDLKPFEQTGYDVFGRPLLKNDELNEKLMSTGLYAPTDRYDAKLQSLYHKAQEKSTRLNASDKELLEKQRQYNISGQAPGVWDNITAPFSALGSATQQLIAGTADMALDVVTPGNNTWLDGLASSEDADKRWGYNRKEANYLQAEMLNDWKQGKHGTAILDAARMAPEVLAESAPTMAMMVGTGGLGGGLLGGTRAAAAMAARGATARAGLTGLEALAPAEQAAAAVKYATTMKGVAQDAELAKNSLGWFTVAGRAAKLEGSTAAGNVLGQIGRFANNNSNAGFLTVVGEQTNQHIDEFTANNGGVGPSATDIARMTATNVLQLGLDKFVFKDIAMANKSVGELADKLGEFKKTMKQAAKVVAPDAVLTTAKAVAKTALSMGEEAGQEYLQTWAEILNKQLGTTGHKDLQSIWNDEKNQDEMLTASLMGAGAGGAMSTAGQPITAGVNWAKEGAAKRSAENLFNLTEKDDARKYLISEGVNHFDDASDPYRQQARQYGALTAATENDDNGFAHSASVAAMAPDTIIDETTGEAMPNIDKNVGRDIAGAPVDLDTSISRMTQTVSSAVKGSNYDSLSGSEKAGADSLIHSTIVDSGKAILDRIYGRSNDQIDITDAVARAEGELAGDVAIDGTNRAAAIKKVIAGFKNAGVDSKVIADLQNYIVNKEIAKLASYAGKSTVVPKTAVENMLKKVQSVFGHSPEDETTGPIGGDETIEEYEKPIAEINKYLQNLLAKANVDGNVGLTADDLAALKTTSGVGREIAEYGFVSGDTNDGRKSISEHMANIKKELKAGIPKKKIDTSVLEPMLNFAAGRADGIEKDAQFYVDPKTGDLKEEVTFAEFNSMNQDGNVKQRQNYFKSRDPLGATATEKLYEAENVFLPKLHELRKFIEMSMLEEDGTTKEGKAFNESKTALLAKIDNAIKMQNDIVKDMKNHLEVLASRKPGEKYSFYAPWIDDNGKMVGYKLVNTHATSEQRNKVYGAKDEETGKRTGTSESNESETGTTESSEAQDGKNGIVIAEEAVDDNQFDVDTFELDESKPLAEQIKDLEQQIEYMMSAVADTMISTAKSLVLNNFKYDSDISIAKNFMAWRKEIAVAARSEAAETKARIAKEIIDLTEMMKSEGMDKKVIAGMTKSKKAEARSEAKTVKEDAAATKEPAYANRQEEIVALRKKLDQLKRKAGKKSTASEKQQDEVYNENQYYESTDATGEANKKSKKARKEKAKAKERESYNPEEQDEAFLADMTPDERAEYDAASAKLEAAMAKMAEEENGVETVNETVEPVVLDINEEPQDDVYESNYDNVDTGDTEFYFDEDEFGDLGPNAQSKPEPKQPTKPEQKKTEEELEKESEEAKVKAELQEKLEEVLIKLYNEATEDGIYNITKALLPNTKPSLEDAKARGRNKDLAPDVVLEIESKAAELKGEIDKVGATEGVANAIDDIVATKIDMLKEAAELAKLEAELAEAKDNNNEVCDGV